MRTRTVYYVHYQILPEIHDPDDTEYSKPFKTLAPCLRAEKEMLKKGNVETQVERHQEFLDEYGRWMGWDADYKAGEMEVITWNGELLRHVSL